MADNTDFQLTLSAWADIVIQIWEDKIEKLNIHESYQLIDSFTTHVVTNSNGDPEKIEFAFNYYGKFVDMGVGGYISIDDLKSGVETTRRAKAWYSKVFFSQVKKLGSILAQKYAKKAALLVVENTDDNALRWGGESI